ncbi:hypothetical protein PFISCL1PPCAC_18025 [Pristionchus fissidentatus]|uniref:Endonuclease/exonuclease/phosphatase domain-containing protein n=1 Tax=Pristionchus fissidentatus TaxID=1538716 RepID=A0AAV5W8G8_9BILA|nr:hypothetical protein PFISCL1PPCAC_18025 [Pristionchus fissidentatus]
MFLYEVRKIHPKAVTEIKGSFIRRDLCPFELELERAARKEAYKLNIKMNCLAYGVCDERLIQFRQPYRPLPANYGNRDPSRKNWNKKKTDEDPPPNEEQPALSSHSSSVSNDTISVFLTNARSIKKKSHILSFLKTLNYNMIMISETWLNVDDSDAYLLGSNANYVSFRKDRPPNAAKSRGGGVAILCSPQLNPILISTFSSDDIEALTIDIHVSSYCKSASFSSIRVCLIYRAPSCSNASLDSLLAYLTALVPSTPFLITGDLNFPDVDWDILTSPVQNDFISFVSDLRFSQYAHFKTRAQNIFDLVLCNSNIVRNVRPSIPLSDHTCISFSLSVPSPPNRKFVPHRLYHLADWVSINNSYIPNSTPSSSSSYPPHLRSLYKKSCLISSIASNSTLAQTCYKRFERALRMHNERVENKVVNSNNPKAFFSLCKTRLKATSNAPPGIIDLNGNSLVTDRDKAHAFSQYFASVSTLPLHAPLPPPPPSQTQPFDLSSITPSQILISIQSLAPKVNFSPDARDLRNTHELRIAVPFIVPKSHSTFVSRSVQRWNALSRETVKSSPIVFRSLINELPSISFTSESLLRL